ncbi:uncharacterized protein PHACADRAFT_171872 [Phanerochaete carnosa HHB-10118-sp]|uniref:BTB domain-containing protein n=1 Tax=Phanerochaete carnosa (strain HHB-10118-sp) TaxID=650164 RepID=K5WHJ7_PHACS|nr:uncharacterized protein PHACADRAFT_171872 [Phanerochaete carnosa HHB-10118-sp]EKM58594.1 hypothetical protein PHACADRAFT_171872 [Phanerochaete carnosa HHB-10118-sp]
MPASTRSNSHAGEVDTPNKKRKIQSEERIDSLQAAPEIGERSKDLWFDDGSVIVAAKDRAFKVHASVLMLRSEVFKELLNGPALAQLPEKLEGCPVLRVEDEGRDFEYLLAIIYNGGNSLRPPIDYTEFRVVVAVAVKYKVKEIINEPIYRLSQVFPTGSVDDWDPDLRPDGDKTPIALVRDDCIDVLSIARLLNMNSILPLVFYTCCNIEEMAAISWGVNHGDGPEFGHISEEDLHTYLEGRQALMKETKKLAGYPANCTTRPQCLLTFQNLSFAALDADFYHEPSPINGMDAWLDTAKEKPNAKPCRHCDKVLRKFINGRREEAWCKLGDIFCIAEWPAGQPTHSELNGCVKQQGGNNAPAGAGAGAAPKNTAAAAS